MIDSRGPLHGTYYGETMPRRQNEIFQGTAPAVRSRMARVRKTDTRPELRVRRAAHGLGYRYRLHRKDLPGTPDLVFPKLRKVIFVHGCFWHQHRACKSATIPRVRQAYWLPKLARNQQRDYATLEALRFKGWHALVIWECETRDARALEAKLAKFLKPKELPLNCH
jgi:DNA mismatch endonuclease, patch repair protein